MGKKKKKNSLGEIRNINVQSFLERYYGISHEGISKMTHKTATSFFPQLRRTSFEFVQKNPELVSTGKIIMVEDAEHFEAPYWMPDMDGLEELVGCTMRERIIHQVVDTFTIAQENNIEGLLLLEGETRLKEDYLFEPVTIHNRFIELGCLGEMMEASSENTGLVLTQAGELLEYTVLNHRDNLYETMMLPPLQRQAVGISRKTDTIGVFYEDGLLGLAIDGERKFYEEAFDMQKDLLRLLPEEEVYEEEREDTIEQEPPTAYVFSEMPTYELVRLMHVYKASGQMGYYHVVRREVVKRTKDAKTYRALKESIKIKEKEEGE